MATEEKGQTIQERIKEELSSLEEKNVTVINEIKTKTEEISRLKESALLIMGAKSILVKILGEENA